MSLLPIALFSFLAAASLAVVIAMIAWRAQTSPHARIRKRLRLIGRHPHASTTELANLLKSSVYSEVKWLNDFLSRLNFVGRVTILLETANLDISVGLFLLLSAFSAAIVLFLFTLLDQPLSLSLLPALVAAALPYAYTRYRSAKRLRLFLEQLPEALDRISQGLRAGMGLVQGLTFVAREMPDPVGTEFAVFMEEVNLGLPLRDGLNNLQTRLPLHELRLFGTALLVQREVGGGLAELLTKVADVIRDRFRIERQIKSLTAQNRMSAWVVSSLPPLLAVFMFAMDAGAMQEVTRDPLGRMMLTTASILEVVGILVFHRLLRIHI